MKEVRWPANYRKFNWKTNYILRLRILVHFTDCLMILYKNILQLPFHDFFFKDSGNTSIKQLKLM